MRGMEPGSVVSRSRGCGFFSRREDGQHDVAAEAEPFCDLSDGDDESAAEAEAGDVTGVDEFVGGRAADAEELGGLLDGDGEGVVDVVLHDLLGRPTTVDLPTHLGFVRPVHHAP